MKNVNIIDHPILNHKLGYLRDKNTQSYLFRAILKEISSFLAYEATKDLTVNSIEVETPVAKAQVARVSNPPVIVSILRAGNGMIDALLDALPFCPAGHIGIYRDKFIDNTVEYYFKLPEDVQGREILLIDPLLATGDTALACIDRLKQYNVGKIKFLTVLAAKSGLEKISHFHPDVEFYTLKVEEELTDKGYLIPGIGDVGDRIFQTK